MKNYSTQTAREIELSNSETQSVLTLAERMPGKMLYKLAEDKMTFVPTGDYFDIMKVHSFCLDLVNAREEDITVSREKRTLASDTRRIFHDLTKGGSQEVGTLRARKVEETQRANTRGFVRILYRTKEDGAVQEGYIICDLNNSPIVRRRFEAEVKAFENAPNQLMNQPGYLMRDDVFLLKEQRGETRKIAVAYGNPTVLGSWTLALALDPKEPQEREHRLVLKGFSMGSSDNYTLEDWAEAIAKHNGEGIQMKDRTIYPTRTWTTMTPQEQTRAVQDLVYKKEVKII